MIWGGMFLIPPLPPFFEGSVPLFGRPFPVYNLFILGAGALVGVLLWLGFDHTWWGRIVRAVVSGSIEELWQHLTADELRLMA